MRLLTSVLAGLMLAPSAHAGTELLGVFKDWTAQTYSQNGVPVCMMWSQPGEAQGDYTTRGDIYVFVTHRPSEKKLDEIRFESGYPFKPSSEVAVTIGEQRFTLTTDASTAWSPGTTQERKMVAAMRSGHSMVVEGTSRRGTRTTDTYSLQGFTAAHKVINKACKI